MNFRDFLSTLSAPVPPPGLSLTLQALWWDKNGDWERSHNIAQSIETPDGAWIHAYLHRKEGDLWNADYWYQKAGKSRPMVSLDDEWEDLVSAFTRA